MSDPLSELRSACARIAVRAQSVTIDEEAVDRYASLLAADQVAATTDRRAHLQTGTREELAAFWLTLDAINFGSGWFPTLRKRRGRSGYFTIATGIRQRFEKHGPWSANAMACIEAAEIAGAVGQDPQHELMESFAGSLRDLGQHVSREYAGRFAAVVDRARASTVALVNALARWRCFDDTAVYEGIRVPFLKRAQIAAADLESARVADFDDFDRLTMFADNVVPHVLRLDGVLVFDPGLVARIERGELIEHGSPEEVEIRACAVHAVERLAAHTNRTPAELDRLLWRRGQQSQYKARPRHRSRSTAY